MNELFHLSFSPANAFPTFLFCFSMVYWLTVFLGALDMSFLDFDVDVDADIDLDVDIEADMGSPESSAAFLNQILLFFGLGYTPFMVFVSFTAIPMWIISMYVTGILGTSLLVGLILLIPNLIVSMFIAKFLTMPFTGLFKKMKQETVNRTELAGKMCTMTIRATSESEGQASVDLDGSQILLTVVTRKGIEMKAGDSGLVIDYNREKDNYLVEPYST